MSLIVGSSQQNFSVQQHIDPVDKNPGQLIIHEGRTYEIVETNELDLVVSELFWTREKLQESNDEVDSLNRQIQVKEIVFSEAVEMLKTARLEALSLEQDMLKVQMELETAKIKLECLSNDLNDSERTLQYAQVMQKQNEEATKRKRMKIQRALTFT